MYADAILYLILLFYWFIVFHLSNSFFLDNVFLSEYKLYKSFCHSQYMVHIEPFYIEHKTAQLLLLIRGYSSFVSTSLFIYTALGKVISHLFDSQKFDVTVTFDFIAIQRDVSLLLLMTVYNNTTTKTHIYFFRK